VIIFYWRNDVTEEKHGKIIDVDTGQLSGSNPVICRVCTNITIETFNFTKRQFQGNKQKQIFVP